MFRAAVSAVAKSSKTLVSSKTFATYKTSTGLVGLAVDPNGRETLSTLSAQILESVQKIPEGNQYRENVQKWFTYVSKVTAETADIKAIEEAIDLGQIEEVIEMAKDELELIDFYHANKGWELVAEAQAEADEIAEKMADAIYFTSPEARARNKPVAEAPKA